MNMTPPWRVVCYESEDGAAPFLDFVARLISEPERLLERAECHAFYELLEKQGGILDGDETYLTHANGLREFRGQFVRVLYECHPDECLVILIRGCLPNEPIEFFDDTI